MSLPRCLRSVVSACVVTALVAVSTLFVAVPEAGASHTSGPGPHLDLTAPTANARTDMPVVISGVAEANGSEFVVNFITLSVKDLTTGRYWNGSEWVIPIGGILRWEIPSTVTRVDADGDPARVSFSATVPATGHRMWIVAHSVSEFANASDVGIQLDNVGDGPAGGGTGVDGTAGGTTPDVDSLEQSELILTKPSPTFGGGQLEIEGFAAESARTVNISSRIQLTVKDLTTQRFWNGSGWQPSYATFDASTTAIGITTETFTTPTSSGIRRTRQFRFNASVPGDAHPFYVTARLITERNSYSGAEVVQTRVGAPTDGTIDGGNSGGASGTAIATSGGNGRPAISIASPSSLVHNGGTITLAGTANDPNGVRRVEVTARNLTTRQYWNGSRFVTPFALATANLANPGATSTAWSVSIPTASAAHYFGVRAIDRSGDHGPFATFQTSVGGTGQPPAATPPPGTVILSPSSGVHNGGTLRFSGTAVDPDGVNRVEVTVRDLVTKRYWNGSSFQLPFALTTATLSNPGANLTNWSISVPTGSVPIYLAARLIDNDNNYLPFESAQTAPS